MKANVPLIAALLVIGLALRAPASPSTTPAAAAADVARQFLRHLEKSEVDDALKLWTAKALNPRVKERVRKMSAKIVASGGIKKLETPPVEPRPKNLKAHEVVVIVIYGNKDLAFGSVSFVDENGQFRISNLRSEAGWGGTTSLFDEDYKGDGAEEPSDD
jgi:hypothetical protein